jgi:cysteine synthase A
MEQKSMGAEVLTMIGSILNAIGSTPIVRLQKVVPPGGGVVVVKLEYYNPTGSYKDRMALAMIEEAEKRGELRPGMRVVEYTGGSTGSSLAMVCAVKGYRFEPLSSDAYAREKIQTMRAFGAEVSLLPSEGGKITLDLFERFKREIRNRAAEPNSFYTDQMNNRDSILGYRKIGEEILQQLDGNISAFCAAVGTGGMLVGVSRVLRESGSRARVVALEPKECPVITEGLPGPHHVEGIGTGFWPPILSQADFDEARTVEESAAREMARRLAKEEGILAGTSTGLNVTAAIRLASELGPGNVVVTVASDSGLKYLAGDLFLT